MISAFFSLGIWMASAQIPEPLILRQDGVTEISLEESLHGIQPGTVLILGEQHYTSVHQNYQLRILEQLRKQGLKVNVGMEFLEYPQQPVLETYLADQMTEPDFLKSISWSGDFSFYRDQILFPKFDQRKTLALNLPRKIASQIAKGGVASLTDEQRLKLPARLERGNEAYFRRFMKAAGEHLPSEKVAENYFMAQSAWDDTMAWKASEFIASHPQEVLVIVVGEFHVQYGGGLPDRLKVWGVPSHNIKTISMVNLSGLNPAERQVEVLPSTEDGPRADILWISEF